MPADHARVRNVVGALNESNLDVFWSRAEPGADEWKSSVDAAQSARAVVFFFSAATNGAGAEPYIALARDRLKADKALCVLLDDVDLPDGLAGCTTYDLRGWRSRASSLFMLDLVAGVRAKAAGLDPPPPRAARQLLVQRLFIAVPSAIAALALLAGLYRDVGADQIASPAEAAAWSSLKPNSCADLRNFLGAHGDGVHAQEAQALLAARRIVRKPTDIISSRPLPLYVSALDAASSPSGGGRAGADARADAEAQRLCRGLADATSSTLISAKARITERQCDGSSCSAGGQAICKLQEPEVRTIEVCGSAD